MSAMLWRVMNVNANGGYDIYDDNGELRGRYSDTEAGSVHHTFAFQEIERLQSELAKYNTEWQHDPPEVGDTKWVKLRYTSPAQPRFDKFTEWEVRNENTR